MRARYYLPGKLHNRATREAMVGILRIPSWNVAHLPNLDDEQASGSLDTGTWNDMARMDAQ